MCEGYLTDSQFHTPPHVEGESGAWIRINIYIINYFPIYNDQLKNLYKTTTNLRYGNFKHLSVIIYPISF